MEIFDKFYSCYYTVVRHILEEASDSGVTKDRLGELCTSYGFQESSLAILPKLLDGSWPFLQKLQDQTYRSLLIHQKKIPLTNLQIAWLSSLLSDPRFCLFFDDWELEKLKKLLEERASSPVLCQSDDFHYFDRYLDGDPYESDLYRQHFRTILSAISCNSILLVDYHGKNGVTTAFTLLPRLLQYSSKNNKFRLLSLQYYRGSFCRNSILNLSKIKECHLSPQSTDAFPELQNTKCQTPQRSSAPVVIRISGERNSLERCMLHFANYEKHTEYDSGTDSWLCSIYYDIADETELLIDILSFGPVITVLGPDTFLQQVKNRVRRQHQLFYQPT